MCSTHLGIRRAAVNGGRGQSSSASTEDTVGAWHSRCARDDPATAGESARAVRRSARSVALKATASDTYHGVRGTSMLERRATHSSTGAGQAYVRQPMGMGRAQVTSAWQKVPPYRPGLS